MFSINLWPVRITYQFAAELRVQSPFSRPTRRVPVDLTSAGANGQLHSLNVFYIITAQATIFKCIRNNRESKHTSRLVLCGFTSP